MFEATDGLMSYPKQNAIKRGHREKVPLGELRPDELEFS